MKYSSAFQMACSGWDLQFLPDWRGLGGPIPQHPDGKQAEGSEGSRKMTARAAALFPYRDPDQILRQPIHITKITDSSKLMEAKMSLVWVLEKLRILDLAYLSFSSSRIK